MFQGIQAVAMPLAQEFGFTREIEDRVQAPVPDLAGGHLQGALRRGAGAHLGRHRPSRSPRSSTPPGWRPTSTCTGWLIVTLVPLACVAMTSLGLLLGTSFEPRNIGLMFGFIVLPITFLGGTYYQWTRLAPVKVGGMHWLQIIVLINPLIYVNEGCGPRSPTPPTCTCTSSTRCSSPSAPSS